MSLVGSLEDLALGDILQIVSLSRKSGLLRLRCEGGEGRILLEDGLVRGAAIKGELEDLGTILVDAGELERDAWERVERVAETAGIEIDAWLSETAGIEVERIEALRRERVEGAVMSMFGWRSGEFTFEVRDASVPGDDTILLKAGISTQYLAMEASRQRDETTRLSEFDAAGDDDDDVPLFSGEGEELPRADAVEALAIHTAQAAGDGDDALRELDVASEPGPTDVPEEGDSTLTLGPEAAAERPSEEAPIEVEVAAARPAPVEVVVEAPARAAHSGLLVAIDPDLGALEWLKASLEDVCDRVHIFQRSEAGFDRIRHYLGRGIVPIAVVAMEAAGDSRTGAAGGPELMRRLRGLAPTMPILALVEPDVAMAEDCDFADGVLVRPASPGSDPERWAAHADVSTALREAVAPWAEGDRPGQRRSVPDTADSRLTRLKAMSDRLRDPSSQGDVLSLVLDFAAESFARVAIFALRDERFVGLAQRGLPEQGGPDDVALAAIDLGADDHPELFRRVLERRRAAIAPPTGSRDVYLAALLGPAAPRQAYVAPIETGGEVTAVLYADNLPHEVSIPDTTALEIVVHEAGLALDRAVLERALSERAEG
jgi:hypothetical protein